MTQYRVLGRSQAVLRSLPLILAMSTFVRLQVFLNSSNPFKGAPPLNDAPLNFSSGTPPLKDWLLVERRKIPKVRYEILTLQRTLDTNPGRRENVERIEKEYPQFVRDIALDAVNDYEEINHIFAKHNAKCALHPSVGNHALWASTLRSWDRMLESEELKDQYDYLVIVQDDHLYNEVIDKQVTKMIEYRWKYFPYQISIPMYSFGHGDGINLYSVPGLRNLLHAFHDEFNKNPRPLDSFYDERGLGVENMNFAWSTLLQAHNNSTLNMMTELAGEEIQCNVTDGKIVKVMK